MAGAIGRGGEVGLGRDDVPPARQELATNGNPAVYWTSAGTIRGPLARPDADALAERSQVAIADPLPLGLAGFASATFTISAVFAGWFRLSDVVVAIPVALVFGGIVQFLAGMWAFRRGSVLAATAFSTFGAFNASWAILEWLGLAHLLPNTAASDPSLVAGVYILTFSLIALYLGIAALSEHRMVAAILLVLGLTYLADGTGTWIGGHNWVLAIGGYLGCLVALMAFYLSAAVVINSSAKREVVPTYEGGPPAEHLPRR
jgi:succinate-acetate transporter protein